MKIDQVKAREKHCIKTIPAKRFERFANLSYFLLAPPKDKPKKTRGRGNVESVANRRAAFNGKLREEALCGGMGGREGGKGGIPGRARDATLGWPLGSMDGRGNAGGGWRGGERSGSWTGLLERMPGELMETLH